MIQPPEIVLTDSARVCCDGATGIRSNGTYRPGALGHPRVWLEIDEKGYVDCGYCDKRFVLEGGPAHPGFREISPGDLPAPGDGSVA
ncbi:MAG: zinc-finger domain-containing protein [Sphingomonadales bacterium]|nr:zinc-finger domain-containing protein [Sphingomonadales bacterium]MDE2569859.1 zinc-finger domain-containing protein [Sphingomonadales bacterium]